MAFQLVLDISANGQAAIREIRNVEGAVKGSAAGISGSTKEMAGSFGRANRAITDFSGGMGGLSSIMRGGVVGGTFLMMKSQMEGLANEAIEFHKKFGDITPELERNIEAWNRYNDGLASVKAKLGDLVLDVAGFGTKLGETAAKLFGTEVGGDAPDSLEARAKQLAAMKAELENIGGTAKQVKDTWVKTWEGMSFLEKATPVGLARGWVEAAMGTKDVLGGDRVAKLKEAISQEEGIIAAARAEEQEKFDAEDLARNLKSRAEQSRFEADINLSAADAKRDLLAELDAAITETERSGTDTRVKIVEDGEARKRQAMRETVDAAREAAQAMAREQEILSQGGSYAYSGFGQTTMLTRGGEEITVPYSQGGGAATGGGGTVINQTNNAGAIFADEALTRQGQSVVTNAQVSATGRGQNWSSMFTVGPPRSI